MVKKALGEHYFLDDDIRINICKVNRKLGETHEHDLTETLHYHDFTEIVIIQKGKGIQIVEGNEYLVSAGDIFVLQGNQAHTFKDADQLEIVNIMFDENNLTNNLNFSSFKDIPGYNALFILEPKYRSLHHFKHMLHLNMKDLARMELIINTLFIEQEDKEDGYGTIMKNKLEELIIYLSRLYTNLKSTEARSLVRIGKVIDYIEENYNANIKLEDMAALTFMSIRNFQRIFKKAIGETPIDYLIQVRLSKARKLLRETATPIGEISIIVGFGECNYFSRKFKKIVGVTPYKYRLQVKVH